MATIVPALGLGWELLLSSHVRGTFAGYGYASANCRYTKRMVGREVITRLLSFLGAPVCWVPVSDLLNAG